MTVTLWTAAQTLAQTYGFYGPVAVYRGGSLHAQAVTIGVLIPGDQPSREQLADLGGGRASKIGSAETGAGILDGDELRATGRTWLVQGAEDTPQILVMALSEVTN
jgi:hypothetical protein